MRVRKTKVIDCSKELYEKFYSLNFRCNGSMRDTLVDLRAKQDSQAVIHYVESDKKVLAWTLSFPNSFIQRYKSYFYIRKDNRRRGLGTKLFNTVEKFFVSNKLKFQIFPHDYGSRKFFTKCTKGKRTDMKNSLIHM